MSNAAIQSILNISHSWGDQMAMNDLLDDIGDAQFVLLGEASHGTHDYYLWRARISQRLITEKGFTLIAVEGDWPDCYRVNRYIKHYPDSGEDAKAVLRSFNRWPTWMWANQEMVEFTEWLREYNARFDLSDQTGFFGLDVYSLWESIQAVVSYLDKVDPQAARQARYAYRCFEPYGEAGERYAYHTAMVPETCEEEVIQILTTLQTKALHSVKDDHELQFNAAQNANIIVNAEHYYRTMLRSDSASWNIRDHHMTETIGNLLRHYGNNSKIIVWAHNTHVGDARYTDMPLSNMVNIGQLMRETYRADQVRLVGFGSYAGSIIAGAYWDAPMQNMPLPPAAQGSWEDMLHAAGSDDKLLVSKEMRNEEDLWSIRPNRAIGVVYDPEHERGNYVPTILPSRYDDFIYIDTTKALRPLHTHIEEDEDYPETFPWGV